jgi:hypothetical protein
MMLFYCW